MNIFVAKLSYDTTEDTLKDLFSQFGAVDSVKIIYDRERGTSKGYGFVEMAEEEEGAAAIEELNDSTVDGRTIVVKKAEPRKRDNNRGGFGGGGGRREWR